MVCKWRTRLGVSQTHFKMDVAVDWIQLPHTYIRHEWNFMWMYVKSWDKDNLKIIYMKIHSKSFMNASEDAGSNNKPPPNGVCRFVCIYVKCYTNSSTMYSRRIGNDAVRVVTAPFDSIFMSLWVRMPCQVSPIRSAASFTEIHSTHEPTVVIHVAHGKYDWHLETIFKTY